MPHELTSPCPTPEINLKINTDKPHTDCTMDGNDQHPKPVLGNSTTDSPRRQHTPHRKIDDKRPRGRYNAQRTNFPMPHTGTESEKSTQKPHTVCTMHGNDQDPKPTLGNSHRTNHTPRKDRRKTTERKTTRHTLPHTGD